MSPSFDVSAATIFVTLAGSQAHGTARDGSDVDLRGICVAPLEARVSLFTTFEQHEGPLQGALWDGVHAKLVAHLTASRGLAVNVESVVYDIAKFLRLCAAANPNALELLFADEADWVFETPVFRTLHAERRRFLSKKTQQTYLGYALAQLRKIRAHRSWLLHPPGAQPTREEHGLPPEGALGREDQHRLEQAIAERVRSYGVETVEMPRATRIAVIDRLEAFYRDTLVRDDDDDVAEGLRATAVKGLSLPEEVVAALAAERRYRTASRHYQSYQTWKAERNPARAALEAVHGYDTKHAMHLLRLMRTGLELLETGELRVRRPDAGELHAVRNGALSYDQLLEQAEALEVRMKAAAKTSFLPKDVDLAFVEALSFSVIEGALR